MCACFFFFFFAFCFCFLSIPSAAFLGFFLEADVFVAFLWFLRFVPLLLSSLSREQRNAAFVPDRAQGKHRSSFLLSFVAPRAELWSFACPTLDLEVGRRALVVVGRGGRGKREADVFPFVSESLLLSKEKLN
jgi:hypothetical protein